MWLQGTVCAGVNGGVTVGRDPFALGTGRGWAWVVCGAVLPSGDGDTGCWPARVPDPGFQTRLLGAAGSRWLAGLGGPRASPGGGCLLADARGLTPSLD